MTKRISVLRKRDVILIVTLLVLSLLMLLLFRMMPTGEYVSVSIAGKHYADLPLDHDTEITLKNGEGVNILRIQNGKASIVSANCPDGLCADHLAVFRVGESIICLPHQIVITVHKQNDESVDIVV